MVAEHTVIPTLEKLRQEDFFRFQAFWGHNPESLPQNNHLGCFDLTVDQPPVHVPPAVTLAQNLKFTGLLLSWEGEEAQESKETLFPGGSLWSCFYAENGKRDRQKD